jgi:hypothetical protein
MTKDNDSDDERQLPPVPHTPKPAHDNDIGYRKPPREHTWKPGRSGNPKGRPKGSKNESTILREVLQHKIDIRGKTGRVRKISVLEGIHLKVADDALRGNIKSAGFLLNRYAVMVSGELERQDLSDDDREVLEAFARRFKANPPTDEWTS